MDYIRVLWFTVLWFRTEPTSHPIQAQGVEPMTVQLPSELVQFDRAGRHLTVYISGEIDALVAPGIADAVLCELRPDDERVWLDFSAVTFCDSSGLSMILRLHGAAADGSLFAVCEPSTQVRHLLDLTGVSGVIHVRTN